jgi:transcription antitermination factor NusG
VGAPTKDIRDEKTWLVLELTHLGEKTAVTGELENHLKDLFGLSSGQVFIPYKICICDGKKTLLNVMEGYCFVEYALDSRDYIVGVRGSAYLKSILHSKIGYSYSLHTIPNSHIQELKEKLNEMASSSLNIGDRVVILRGIYEGVEGEILSLQEETACVVIRMRSLEAVRVLPKYALSPVDSELDLSSDQDLNAEVYDE